MKFGLQELDWAYIGSVLAHQSDDEQSQFLKAFIKECLSWGTRFQVEQQLAFVNHKLTSDERDILGMLSYNEPENK